MPRLVIALLIAALPATGFSQGETLDPVYVEAFGGMYSIDCSDPDADSLEVLADRLIFSGLGEEWVGTGILAARSYWGRNPPPGFEIALMGGNGPEGLLFEVYIDEAGQYILMDGYKALLGDGDESAEEPKFFHCPPEDD